MVVLSFAIKYELHYHTEQSTKQAHGRVRLFNMTISYERARTTCFSL